MSDTNGEAVIIDAASLHMLLAAGRGLLKSAAMARRDGNSLDGRSSAALAIAVQHAELALGVHQGVSG